MGHRIRAAPRVRLCDLCRERPCRTQADPRVRRASVLHLRWLFLPLPLAALSGPGEPRRGTPPDPGAMCLTPRSNARGQALHGLLSPMIRNDPICAGHRRSVLVHGSCRRTRPSAVGRADDRPHDLRGGRLWRGLVVDCPLMSRWRGRTGRTAQRSRCGEDGASPCSGNLRSDQSTSSSLRLSRDRPDAPAVVRALSPLRSAVRAGSVVSAGTARCFRRLAVVVVHHPRDCSSFVRSG
jgi:hypothetical protein